MFFFTEIEIADALRENNTLIQPYATPMFYMENAEPHGYLRHIV